MVVALASAFVEEFNKANIKQCRYRLKTPVLFAATKCEDNEVSPLIAENMRLHWYLMRADHRHLRNLMDVETIVKCVYGNIVFDYLDLEILARLENASVRFVKRDCNNVAHSLVGLACLVLMLR
jgi:hypothetical protein